MFKKRTDHSIKKAVNITKYQNQEPDFPPVPDVSDSVKTPLPFIPVAERGEFFGLGTHKVTGKEFNTALSKIYDELIQSRQSELTMYDYITALSKSIDALDADHVSGILVASNIAKAADDKANENSQNIEKLVSLFKNNPYYQEEKQALEKKVATANTVAVGAIVLTVIVLVFNIVGII